MAHHRPGAHHLRRLWPGHLVLSRAAALARRGPGNLSDRLAWIVAARGGARSPDSLATAQRSPRFSQSLALGSLRALPQGSPASSSQRQPDRPAGGSGILLSDATTLGGPQPGHPTVILRPQQFPGPAADRTGLLPLAAGHRRTAPAPARRFPEPGRLGPAHPGLRAGAELGCRDLRDLPHQLSRALCLSGKSPCP